MSNLVNSGEDVISSSIVSDGANFCIQYNDEDLANVYCIQRCMNWIIVNKFSEVSFYILMPSCNLIHNIRFVFKVWIEDSTKLSLRNEIFTIRHIQTNALGKKINWNLLSNGRIYEKTAIEYSKILLKCYEAISTCLNACESFIQLA